VKCKTDHGKNEEKNEFGSLWNESLGFKCGTPIMLGTHRIFEICISPLEDKFTNLTITKKHVILTRQSRQEGPHLDKRQKDHPINLNKSIWTCPV
jgi:hypothetical protein